jgi:hypothetical protein
MKKILFVFLFVALAGSVVASPKFFTADNSLIQYTGRVDFSNPKKPRFWAAGVYIQAKFKGTSCEVVINDEMLWGNSHNYILVIVDNAKPLKIKLKERSNTIKVADELSPGTHTITIYKNTEALIGYLEFVGIKCDELVAMPNKPSRKIEFIGNSITSGMGNDLEIPCGKGDWYDQHNAYLSYGSIVARQLNAQWHLTSESGIGLIHSCCNKKILMPQVFDKVSISKDSMVWDFSRYQPDLVTVTLGQNDGVQDSLQFCSAYVDFVRRLRGYYPNAQIVCLTSPMANEKLAVAMKKYLTGIVSHLNSSGDRRVDKFFYSKSYNNGCGGHPDLSDHKLIAAELLGFVTRKMKWK